MVCAPSPPAARLGARMSKATSRPITECQVCRSPNLTSVLFLAYVAPVNSMARIGTRAVEQPCYPLEWLRCGNCGLVQIGTECDPAVLFAPTEPYRSGTTLILRDNF